MFSQGLTSPNGLVYVALGPEHFSVLNGGVPAKWQSRQRTRAAKGADGWRLALLLVMDAGLRTRPLSAAVARILGDAVHFDTTAELPRRTFSVFGLQRATVPQ